MSEFKKIKLAEIRAIIENRLEEKAGNPRAIGMAAAMKKTGDKPPLKKSTIRKAHEIADAIMKKEEVQQIDEIGNTPAGKKALVSYIGKRANSLNYDSDTAYGLGQDDPDAWDKLDSGTKGIERAAKRLAKEESGETYDTTTHAPTSVKPIKKFKGKAPVDPVSTHEEVEQIDENWDKGSSSSYHSDRAKAVEYEKKANSTLATAKGLGKDHPNYRKLMGDYHSAMAKHVKHAYHGSYQGGYPSQAHAKKEYNAHIRQAKEYRSEVNEEVEQIDELKTTTLQSYREKARAQGNAIVDKMKMGGGDWSKDQKDTNTLRKRYAGAQMSGKTLRKRGESLATESADMLDTSLSDIDASKTGEVYKKVKEKSTAPAAPTGTATHVVAGKDGEAYNTTGITKRVPAVESAVLEVMAQTMQKRKMFEDAANIAIISQDQRQDWLDVSTGKMDVVDYFNKYKV